MRGRGRSDRATVDSIQQLDTGEIYIEFKAGDLTYKYKFTPSENGYSPEKIYQKMTPQGIRSEAGQQNSLMEENQ
mgnify:CR=1 FL=1